MPRLHGGQSAPAALAPVIMATPPADLSASERRKLRTLEGRISAGIGAFMDVGHALLEIRDSRLYRETHKSFEAYCRDKWGLERARAYQLMTAAEVVAALPDGKRPLIVNEAQARALAPVLNEQGVAGATRVLEDVRGRGVPITAPLIRQAAGVALNHQETTLTDRLVRDMTRLVAEYRQWLESKPGRREKTAVKTAMDTLIQSLE